MACCGQNRTEVSTHPAGTSNAPINGTLLRYLETRPILVRGPSTGQHYSFSEAQPTRAVDPRDADALVRTGLFSKQL